MSVAETTAANVVDKYPSCHYKFGIARNPIWRFTQYQDIEGYTKMFVLAVMARAPEAAMLEACMISMYHGEPGLDNIASGGERPPSGDGNEPFFVYMVSKTAWGAATARATRRAP